MESAKADILIRGKIRELLINAKFLQTLVVSNLGNLDGSKKSLEEFIEISSLSGKPEDDNVDLKGGFEKLIEEIKK